MARVFSVQLSLSSIVTPRYLYDETISISSSLIVSWVVGGVFFLKSIRVSFVFFGLSSRWLASHHATMFSTSLMYVESSSSVVSPIKASSSAYFSGLSFPVIVGLQSEMYRLQSTGEITCGHFQQRLRPVEFVLAPI